MRIVLFFFFATLVCAFGKPTETAKHVPTLDGRIIDGSSVDIIQYPHQVSLVYSGRHICGGSIISPKWVLTAAHCVIDINIYVLAIRAGSSTRNSGGTTVSAKDAYYNADYNEETFDYDIAAVELSAMLTYSTVIQPVQLPYENQHINSGTVLTVTGWGWTIPGGSPSNQLLAVDVPVVSTPVCAASYILEGYEITERMLCAGYDKGGKDACSGDSGGALVANNVQWGIVSWGYGCAVPKFYGVYAHVPNLRSWISRVTGV